MIGGLSWIFLNKEDGNGNATILDKLEYEFEVLCS